MIGDSWEDRIGDWTLADVDARLDAMTPGECFFPTCPDPAGARTVHLAEDGRQAPLCAADFLRFHDFCHARHAWHEHDEDFPETRA